MEAAELLGISERTFRRSRDRRRDDGQAGLADRRLTPSPRRASVAEIERMLGLYRDLYRGFTVKHCQSALNSFQVTAPKSFHLIRPVSTAFCVV